MQKWKLGYTLSYLSSEWPLSAEAISEIDTSLSERESAL